MPGPGQRAARSGSGSACLGFDEGPGHFHSLLWFWSPRLGWLDPSSETLRCAPRNTNKTWAPAVWSFTLKATLLGCHRENQKFAEIKVLTEICIAMETWNLDSNPVLSESNAWALSIITRTLHWHGGVMEPHSHQNSLPRGYAKSPEFPEEDR